MRLILWDVDGTLLRAGPAAAEIFTEAVAAVVGVDASGHGVTMSGKTDPQIAGEILTRLGVPETAARQAVPAILDLLADRLSAHLDRVQREGRVLPGVPELLARLAAEGARQTLLTGNIAANARAKTAALGLDGWFDWRIGAFGSDHGDRAELVAVAHRRAVATLGVAPEVTWVIGDTPADLACARAGRARCLLVATGRFARAELAAGGADAVVDDLSDTEDVARLLRA